VRRERALALVVGALLTLAIVALHLEFHRNAGALWRDEVNSVNAATLPTFADTFASMHLDSFPAAWLTVLRSWISLGLGETDAGLRRLGLVIGLGTLAVLWWTGWRLSQGPPLVAVLLFGMSPTAIVYGDEVRGYGLGVLAILWCMGAFWSYLERPRRATLLLALAAALVATEAHYTNAILLAAIGAGAGSVCLARGEWRRLGVIASIGLAAGIALVAINWTALEYMPRTAPMLVEDLGLGFQLEVFAFSAAPRVPVLGVLWGIAVLLACLGLALAALRPRSEGERERALYAGVTLLAALLAYFVALSLAGLGKNYWYYLSLLAVVAVACDAGVALLVGRAPRGDLLRSAVVAGAALLVASEVARTVPLRMTDVDLAAKRLEEIAGPDDLIVVLRWYSGITFDRYYRGRAPWITLPDVSDHRFHHHLEIAERMQRGDGAVAAELERVERTLQSGGNVFVVGRVRAPDPGHAPPRLPPAPGGPRGWHADPYLEAWELQLGALLERHGRERIQVPLPETGMVSAWESLPVGMVRGWR
jgi:hypothetical protein